jgi:uncharacterized protein YbjT (DUF2867 family)
LPDLNNGCCHFSFSYNFPESRLYTFVISNETNKNMTTKKSPSILITGATGSVGTELARALAAKGIPFRALVRSFENAATLAYLGAELAIGDLNDLQSIRNALQGIERAFLLTNSSEQAEQLQTNFVNAACETGVQHIVKLSQFAADIHSPVRFLRYHAAIEQKIKATDIDYTFLRPNLYMQGFLGFREPITKQGKFFAAVGDAKISAVDVRDIAAVAAAALTESNHANKIYNITGPEALTHTEMAMRFSDAFGYQVKFINVSPQEMRHALLHVGFPVWQADGLLEDYAHYARGEASEISTAVHDSTGHAPRTFQAFAQNYASLFQLPATATAL